MRAERQRQRPNLKVIFRLRDRDKDRISKEINRQETNTSIWNVINWQKDGIECEIMRRLCPFASELNKSKIRWMSGRSGNKSNMIGNELSNESNEWTAAQKPSDTGNMQQLLHCRVSFEVTIHALGFLSVSNEKKSFFHFLTGTTRTDVQTSLRVAFTRD